MTSKILVIGGSGFIGSYLMPELPNAMNLDLKDGQDIRDGISGSYDLIIFLACNQANTKEAYQENWDMFKALDMYRKTADAEPYLIYISSAAVYTLNSWYALSKQLGEAYAVRFMDCVILRPSNIYGHGDGHGAPDRFMRGERTINGFGTQIRDLIPVEKVVSFILQYSWNRQSAVLNISSGVGTSVKDMFELFGQGEPLYTRAEADVGIGISILPPGAVKW